MLPLQEARKNDEVISLADSQVLRWIDELNGITDADSTAMTIKREINMARRLPDSAVTRKKIKQLYNKLDEVQFKQDYLFLIIDKEKDYWRACSGFKVNGVEYVRLLGTTGGVKNSTIVFISKRLSHDIKERIDNGRDMSKMMVPAKLEAYKALACSASIPVSAPNGVLVVDDCETTFKADIIYLDDDCDGEPTMELRTDYEVTLDESDGYGLMSPALAERWSQELGLGYVSSGFNTRASFEKGMVFTFDYVDFANKVAGSYIVKDAWGNDVDVRNVELVLTTSMLKLYDSYKSCEDYLENCRKNKYTFCITKTCPEKLSREHTTNYQFLQVLNLDDEALDKLCEPTVSRIEDIMGYDVAKTALYLNGGSMTDTSVANMLNGWVKALLIEPELIKDKYISDSIYKLIKNRIDEAKVGVLNVSGNYSIVCGDPYSLCQHMFGMEVTGILRSGEIYNQYWSDIGADRVACFRAPMSCPNNALLMHVHRSDAASYWYRYMNACTLFNSWDCASMSLNGMDKDGDLVMLTDNEYIIGGLCDRPALTCVQRKATKKIVTEADSVQANIDSFGDDIGKTTNWITSMYDVQAHFEPGTKEYEVLAYRIKCGQLFQQNAIDRAKGIISKPMPKEWHDYRAVCQMEDGDLRALYKTIVADKKPYFMRYIYPTLMRQYNTYMSNTRKNALREFQMDIEDLLEMPADDMTEEQVSFVKSYYNHFPVGNGDCVVNRICRKFESIFDNRLLKNSYGDFDYSILKSGVSYSQSKKAAVQSLYKEFNKRCSDFLVATRCKRDSDEYRLSIADMKREFISRCSQVCSDRFELCDIVLDVCYKKNSSKSFAWEMCGSEIIENLLRRNGGCMHYPVRDDSGSIVYGGERFSMREILV